MLIREPLLAQVARASAAGAASPAFAKVNQAFMLTPKQALDWHIFKAECGPTYAGSVGWKRFNDLLLAKMPEFGGVDLDFVEISYDHYIVDDWPDRRTHIHDSGVAVEKLVTDGTPVPVVASYGMTSGSTPRRGHHRADALLRSGESARTPRRSRARFSSSKRPSSRLRRTAIRFSTTTR